GRTLEGSGIGLALVQELVKLHNGSISAESVLGKGTEFKVSVPVSSSHVPKERINSKPTTASTSVKAVAYLDEALRWLPDGEPSESILPDSTSSARPQNLPASRELMPSM